MINILVLAWGENGELLKSSVHGLEHAADITARGWLKNEEIAHVVKYHTTFKPGEQPETHLDPYGWYEQTE